MRIIRGKYGRRRFDVPTNITARPTTDFARENIFNVIENITDIEGARCLDLFAGTGAVSFEFLSRDAASVTSVEKSPIQGRFIEKVARELGDSNIRLLRADAVRYIRDAVTPFDIIFADPPYNMEGFADIPAAVLSSRLIKPGSVFIMEHSKAYDFSSLPHFDHHRAYGSVNFSIFVVPSEADSASELAGENEKNTADTAVASRCLPQNLSTTALKRVNMALRWLVRDDGIVDMGIWDVIKPSQLFIPLDVHVGDVSRELGLLSRKSDDKRAVLELTGHLRRFNPSDPVIYDYALFGIGMRL